MVDRAFSLLYAFSPADPELSLAELCRRTGIAKPTAHRILGELASWGLVERAGTGYRLGMGLFELGARAPAQLSLREAAAPVLADLAEATRETVHLAMLRETDVVYIQKLAGRNAPKLGSRLGGRMPAYCTGVGKALLAFSDAETIQAALAAGLARRTARTIVAPGLFRRELAMVRRRGYAEEHEESSRGIACVAAPVVGADGLALAAVSITGWASRLNTERLAPAVRTAALGVGRAVARSASRTAG
jgi:DNA-binding IclR family transcriptional regulator